MRRARARVVHRRSSSAGDDEPQSRRRRVEGPADAADAGGGGGGISQATQNAGTVSHLELKNFMCHKNFKLDFNSNVNFITGQNGSGKSAVLTAVVVGLGGRTSATDRGTSISSLIRTEQPSAVVSVTLCNAGEEAFAPDTFGETITVERTIRASGVSSYRLLNAHGRPVSTKKSDLTEMMDALNIQVDNPIAILTQETSKNFLRSEDPGKKYKLFLSATRLSHIHQWYDEARKHEHSSTSALGAKKECLLALESAVKKHEHEVNICKNRQGIQQKIELLEQKLLWARVIEKEKALEEATEEHSKKKQAVDQLTNKRAQWEDKIARTDQEKARVQQQQEELAQQGAEKERVIKEVETELRQAQARQREAAGRLETVRTKCRNQEGERDNLRQEIARVRNSVQPDLAAESQRRQQKIAGLESELQQLEATEKTQHGHMQHVTGSRQQQQDEVRRLEVEERERQKKCRELDNELREQRANQANPRTVFGPWVAAVDQDIDNCWRQKRFRKKPIGPIGAHIRLRAGCDEWKPLVETCLASLLRAYLVDDQSDLRLMSAILSKHTQRVPQKPRVIASKFLNEVHNVSRHGIDTSDGRRVSVWSVLDIQHPVVANAVIDHARAESVLLLRTDAEARETMAYRERVPRGCAQALTCTGFRYYPDPGYRTYPISVPRQARYLQVSVEDVIRDLSGRQQKCRDEAQEVTLRLGPAREELLGGQRQEREARQQLERVRRKKQAVQAELRQLKSQEDPEPINLQTLIEEEDSYTQTIQDLKEAQTPLVKEKEDRDKEVEELKTKRQRAAENIQSEFNDRLKSLRSELDAVESLREKLRLALDRSLPQLEARQKELKALTKTIDDRRREVTASTASAADVTGERLQPEKSASQLESRLRGLKRSLENAAGEQELIWEEVSERFQQAQLAHQRAKADVTALTVELEKLKSMLKERNRNYCKLKDSLANRITQYFSTILIAGGFRGRMNFRHDEQKLVIEVHPRQQGGGGPTPTTQRLSGGERSFSTLAFVLAMWKAMPSPFRILDEFDVFMDEMNRKISHDVLLKNALDHNSQFVFITPLDIPGERNNDRITIHQMKAPRED